MDRDQVVRTLKDLADLLEMAEANPFEVRAYRNGAMNLEEWSGDLDQAVRDETLTEIDGVGKGLAKVISDLVRTGASEDGDRIRGLVPEQLLELRVVPGLGPKKIRRLYQELEIDSLTSLEAAAAAERIRELKGFGKTSEEKILAAVRRRAAPRAARTTPGPAVATHAPASHRRRGDGEIHAGTSGYSYKEWRGSFYPEDLPPSEMLAAYARRLPTVEINNTFYRMPKPNVVEGWRDQAPDDFRFVIKASQRITHFKRLRDAQEETAFLLSRTALLGERLAAILFQLPPNDRADPARLEAFLAHLPEGTPAAFEFRHDSWFQEEIYELLRSRNCALCVADDDGDDPIPELVTTADWGYLRLRRASYEDSDLIGWAERIRAQGWKETYVFFKHEDEGAGPELALRFLELAAAPALKQAASERLPTRRVAASAPARKKDAVRRRTGGPRSG